MAATKRKPARSAKSVPVIGVVMGSQSDFSVMQQANKILKEFGVPFETKIVSAHRTPKRLVEYAETASSRGLKAIIAGAGGAAHLPGMLAAMTTVPVLGVPVPTTALNGIDSLYSIVQMPKGVPVATFAVGEHGAINAALFAIATLAPHDSKLAKKLATYRQKQTSSVPDIPKAKGLK